MHNATHAIDFAAAFCTVANYTHDRNNFREGCFSLQKVNRGYPGCRGRILGSENV
jgi:hypothetical protein